MSEKATDPTPEFYTRAVFRVADVARSGDYYCDKLGFERGWCHPDPAPIIGQVGRNGLDLILDSHSVLPKPATTSVLAMTLQRGDALHALYEELRERGAQLRGEPGQVVWQPGVYQFEVEDLDGNLLVFWGEPQG